ncbi:MAG: hypothetical protein OXR82_11035 [Gammaproteobacteria bacterium]|nr:hypothetical protein [Gammaproteobacteria bacterium]MDE0258900.1 hypothetical protein [Gammaproteobacteria bacterium]
MNLGAWRRWSRHDASVVAGAGFTVPLAASLNFGAEVMYLDGVLGIDEEYTMTGSLHGDGGVRDSAGVRRIAT